MTEEKPAEDIIEPVQEPSKDVDASAKMIDSANEAAARLEEASKQVTINLDRQERLKAQQALGGSTVAGSDGSVKETDAEYAARIMAGDTDESKDKRT